MSHKRVKWICTANVTLQKIDMPGKGQGSFLKHLGNSKVSLVTQRLGKSVLVKLLDKDGNKILEYVYTIFLLTH